MTSTETLNASGAETKNAPRTLRKIGAILAGFLVTVILTLGTDAILFALHIFNTDMSDRLFLIATAHRIVYGVAGTYVTALLAPDRPMKYAMIGGVIGLVLSIIGLLVAFAGGPELGQKWYSTALVVTALPCAWLGGKLRQMQLEQRRID